MFSPNQLLHFEDGDVKCSLVAKSQVSEVSRKLEEALLFSLLHLFPCSSQNGFGWRTAPPNTPTESLILWRADDAEKLLVDLKTVNCLGYHYSKHMPLQSSVLVLLVSKI